MPNCQMPKGERILLSPNNNWSEVKQTSFKTDMQTCPPLASHLHGIRLRTKAAATTRSGDFMAVVISHRAAQMESAISHVVPVVRLRFRFGDDTFVFPRINYSVLARPSLSNLSLAASSLPPQKTRALFSGSYRFKLMLQVW